MTEFTFTKMHGLGNDFVVIDATETPFMLDNATIGALGHRKTGIGFDQLLVVEPPSDTSVDFNYRIFNTDGGEVEHCGNGARCFARFVIQHGLTDKTNLRVKVKKGIISIAYHDDDHIEVDMGAPILLPAHVPFATNGQQISDSDVYQTQYDLLLHRETIPVSVLSMGNPHAVFMVSDLWHLKIADLAKFVQASAYFPQSVNVNFIEILDEKTLHLRTYERGVGETDACGTGACASVFAAYQLHAVSDNVSVTVRGGQLNIRLEGGRVYMAGPAREVYSGRLSLPLS